MSFIEDAWTNHRTLTIIVGIVLFPLALAIIGFRIYMALNLDGAKKSLDKAQKTDGTLSKQEDDLKKQADSTLAESNKIAQKIEDRHAEGAVDTDWQNKRKD